MSKKQRVARKFFAVGLAVVMFFVILGLMGTGPDQYHQKHFDTLEELKRFLPDFYFFEFELEDIGSRTYTATSRDLASACVSPFVFICSGCSPFVSIDDAEWVGYIVHNFRGGTRPSLGANHSEMRSAFSITANPLHETIIWDLPYAETSTRRTMEIDGVKIAVSHSFPSHSVIPGGKRIILVRAFFELNNVLYRIVQEIITENIEKYEKYIDRFVSIITPAIYGRQKGSSVI